MPENHESIAPLQETFYRQKISQIQAQLDRQKLEGILLLDMYNIIYASGFFHSPSERPIGLFIPVGGEPVLFVPLLEQDHAAETWIKDIRSYFEYPGETAPILWMARETGAKRLGIDGLEHEHFVSLCDAGVDLVTTSLVTHLRWQKDPNELTLIRRAAHYADYCLEQVYASAGAIVAEGGTEVDILNACLSATQAKMQAQLGAAFEKTKTAVVGTVHTGPRAALPHGKPIARRPEAGDVLIAGIGVAVGGYHAESGATFVFGEPSADQLACLRAAARCNDAAVEALRHDVTCAEVNARALAALHEAGLEPWIRHRIGHGMGVQGHESPWLAPGDPTPVRPGMVFSNEPGIYRPGLDGYRTINTMIVTEGEPEVTSRFLAEHPPEQRILAMEG